MRTQRSNGENSLITSLTELSRGKPAVSPRPIARIGERAADKAEALSLVEQIKWALRGRTPDYNQNTGPNFDGLGEFDVFVENIVGARQVGNKSVILLAVKPTNGKTTNGKAGKTEEFIFSKKPPESLTNDPALVDIGYDGNGYVKVRTDAYTYYIAGRKKKTNGDQTKAGETEELDLDIILEITGNHELDAIGEFFLRLDNREINTIVTQAQFKADRTIAKKVDKMEIKTEAGSQLPYHEAVTEDGRTYNIYLIEEKDVGGRKVWDQVKSEVTAQYPLPECYESCVKVDTGQHRYAVFIVV